MIKKRILNFFFIICIFLTDRLSKVWVIGNEKISGESYFSVAPFLNFDLIWNDGIAFGLFSFEHKTSYNLMTAVIVLITLIIFWMITKTKDIEKLGFMMIFGGSLGNIFDRLYYNSVPDFIDIYINNFHWFIFNVADIFISLGVILLIVLELFRKNKS